MFSRSAIQTRANKSAQGGAAPSLASPTWVQPKRYESAAFETAAHRSQDLSATPAHSQALSRFPHGPTLENAFQRKIPGQALVDVEGCARRSVPAFTDQTTVHFASPKPLLRVAAHEAVHVLQHAGVSRDASLGAERHADTVAQSIAKGAPVAHLLGQAGTVVEPSLRLYTVVDPSPRGWNSPGGGWVRVSGDGKMAVQPLRRKNSFWAAPEVINESNKSLAKNGSVIQLFTAGNSLRRKRPGAPNTEDPVTLERVFPKNLSNGTEGEGMTIWADCGRCARAVMGAGEKAYKPAQIGEAWSPPTPPPEGKGLGPVTAAYKAVQRPWPWYFFGGPKAGAEITIPANDPQAMAARFLQETLGGHHARSKYSERMTEERRAKFAEETETNVRAEPKTGEGWAMVKGGESKLKEAEEGRKQLLALWEFHWGGVVATSGQDRVTLENFSTSDTEEKNSKWEFQMYGPAGKTEPPGQTFFEKHEEEEQLGTRPLAMRVQKEQ